MVRVSGFPRLAQMNVDSASPDAAETTVHPSAVVLPGATLGRGVEIGPGAYLESGVEVGDGCRIGPHVQLLGRTLLGPGCVVRGGSVLGGDPQDDAYKGERTVVRVGAGCQIHEHVTIHRASGEGNETVVGDGVRLMASSHVGHNARVGDHVVMVNGAVVGGHATIGERAILSAYSGMHQFGRVGRLTMLTSSSGMSRDAPPFSIVSGSHPTRWRGPNTVGLRRAGFEAEERNAVRRALHEAFTSDLGLRAVAERLAGSDYPAVQELAEFLLTSKRGLCAGPR